MTVAAPLEVELRVFAHHRREWSKTHLGKFVVIQGDTVLDGFFEVYAEAFTAGLNRFGVDRNFLVKQIWKTEPIYFVT